MLCIPLNILSCAASNNRVFVTNASFEVSARRFPYYLRVPYSNSHKSSLCQPSWMRTMTVELHRNVQTLRIRCPCPLHSFYAWGCDLQVTCGERRADYCLARWICQCVCCPCDMHLHASTPPCSVLQAHPHCQLVQISGKDSGMPWGTEVAVPTSSLGAARVCQWQAPGFLNQEGPGAVCVGFWGLHTKGQTSSRYQFWHHPHFHCIKDYMKHVLYHG